MDSWLNRSLAITIAVSTVIGSVIRRTFSEGHRAAPNGGAACPN